MVKMRIIHTDTDDIENPLRGGQPVRTYEINSRLAVNNDVRVFTATYKGSQDKVIRNHIQYERLGFTLPYWGLSSHLSFLARLPSAIKRTPHDIIVEEFTPPFGFCGLSRFTDKPVIAMVQWFFFKDWERRYKLPFEQMMRKKASLRPYQNIIVQTDKMGEYFKDLLPQAKIYKVPCGINQSSFQISETLGDYALYLGRLDIQHKGLDDLIQAWMLLKSSGSNIPLWIVGAGQDEVKLKQLVGDLGLSDLVKFKGRLEGSAKYKALLDCRFLVMPSRQETFGLTALEAMASSKPVIAYDIDHLNELLKPQWSILVKMGNLELLAKAVLDYWNKQALCQQHGERAFQEAKNYLWDNLAEKQEQIYLNI